MAFPTSGLLAYYKLDENTGISAADATGNGNTGTLAGNSITPTWVTGKINSGLSFDGSPSNLEHVDCGTGIHPAAITFTCWVNITAFTNDYAAPISRNGAANDFAALMIHTNGKLAMYVGDSGANTSYDGTGSRTLTTGTWYLLALTYDSTNGLNGYVGDGGTLYADGTGGAIGGLAATSLHTWIGNDPITTTRQFNGVIDEVGIWSRALTSTELSDLYNSGSGLAYPGGGGGGAIILPPPLFNIMAL